MDGVDGSSQGRALRQRTAQPPYRPRPALTSSDRGKANAELRRRRELGVNLVFAEANESIANVKATTSSANGTSEEAESNATIEGDGEVEPVLSLEVADVNLGVEGKGLAEDRGNTSHTFTEEHASSPPTKKPRIVEEDEYDDDDGFFEQIVATDAIDWEHLGSPTPALIKPDDEEPSMEADGYQYIQMMREKNPETNGFRWSNDKEVRITQKGAEKGRKIVERIKLETDMDFPIEEDSTYSRQNTFEAPRPPPSRTVLAPISNNTFNRRLGPARIPSGIQNGAQSAREGKRKLQEETELGETPSTPFKASSSLLNTPDRRTPIRPNISPLPQTPNTSKSSIRLGSMFRTSTPLRSAPFTSTPKQGPASVPRTPRIALGMTPRRSVSASVPRFQTPFKNRERQETPIETQRSPDLFKIPPASRGASSFTIVIQPLIARSALLVPQSVFNLDHQLLERKSLLAMGFDPEQNSAFDARQQLTGEVYDAIKQILNNPSRALKYAFAVEEEYLGRDGIHSMLSQASGTKLEIPKAWIDNHYVLILWKLAAYTRHMLNDQYWHWQEVCRQFKYRYEREYNRKQFSAVKKIISEDCPSTKPIVLCVFQIPPFNRKQEEQQNIVLTDGWYKIRAVVDKVLCLAIYGVEQKEEDIKTPSKPIRRARSSASSNRPVKEGFIVAFSKANPNESLDDEDREEDGSSTTSDNINYPLDMNSKKIRIQVGSKLAIQGAGLSSDVEGGDPLRSFDRVRLIIGGNTSKLAAWNAKLGFTRDSFIGTIRSLSAEGGIVPLMDIVVEKMFPVAFTGDDCCPGYQNTTAGYIAEWNQEEEEERKKVWQEHQEAAIRVIEKEHEDEVQELTLICEQLEQAYDCLSENPSFDGENSIKLLLRGFHRADLFYSSFAAVDPSSCEEMLNAIIVAGSASGYLGMVQLIPQLRLLAMKKLREGQERLQGGIEKILLRRLGQRKIRSFRFIRFRDARPEDYGRPGQPCSKRLQCQRTALLRIWDYAERKESGLELAQSEGDHFMVSLN